MDESCVEADIGFLGGGAAGLWLAKTLSIEGYSTQLFSLGPLGLGQTLWSQGIIHGGIKYFLSGRKSSIGAALPDMPTRWRQHLRGDCQPSLAEVRQRCETCYLLSDGSPWSQMRSFLGNKLLQGEVKSVPALERPEFLRFHSGALYRLKDLVVDVPDLLAELSRGLSCWDVSGLTPSFQFESGAWRIAYGRAVVRCRLLVFAAGAANAQLAKAAGVQAPPMQVRPLQQVIAHGRDLPEIYAHCIGGGFSAAPLLTVTTHRGGPQGSFWSLGGGVATLDSASEGQSINAARAALERFFPNTDAMVEGWEVANVLRAEVDHGGKLPAAPHCSFIADRQALVVWPTKLSFIPTLGDMALACLREAEFEPSASECAPKLALPSARVGLSPWDQSDAQTQAGSA